jgi:hypothetical protein
LGLAYWIKLLLLPTQIRTGRIAARTTTERTSWLSGWQLSHLVLIAAFLLFVLPPMIEVARFNWTTEQGGHGPIVMATGLVAAHREYSKVRHLAVPGNPLLGFGPC